MQLSDEALLDLALREAHLPSLIVTLAQLTGRMDLLRDAWRPTYIPYTDQRDGGLSVEAQADLAEVARALIPGLMARTAPAARPSAADLRRMMDFVAGAPIPERYLPLLEE